MNKLENDLSDPHDREPIDQATIDCWRINYGLDKRTPAEAARYWADTCAGMAPAGAVAALGVALDELAAERKDAERYRWLKESESLVWPSADLANACHGAQRTGNGALIDAEIDRQIARLFREQCREIRRKATGGAPEHA